MSSLLAVVAVTLGLLLLWGLFAPRSNWRSLTGWSVSDPHGAEPGATSYGVRRLVSALGALGIIGVLVIASTNYIANLPQPAPPLSSVRIMWGEPDPQVVNRVVTPLAVAPTDLQPMPVLGYQAFGSNGAPSYLTRLKPFTRLGQSDVAGYVGKDPDIGLAAIDTASLVLHVRGPILCIPRQVVVIETDTAVQVGVFYGLPDSADGSPVDHLAGCPTGSTLTASLLIPISLAAPLGDRKVQALDGSDIESVPVVTAAGN